MLEAAFYERGRKMSDTPETKAFKTRIRGIDGDKHWVPAFFAETLERERDKARRERDEAREKYTELLSVLKSNES
jgi:hypothetical protein